MKCWLCLLVVGACLFGMMLTGCDPVLDEKAEQIKQSGIDIFDPDNYKTGMKGEIIAAEEIVGAGVLHCSFGTLTEQFADPTLFELVGQAGIFIWNPSAEDASDHATVRMPDLGPDDRRPAIFSADSDLYHDVYEVLFCTGVPNIGDYLFYRRPDLTRVYLPDSVTEIGEHAFADNCQTTIYCHAGSYAEQYAKDHGIKYAIVKE